MATAKKAAKKLGAGDHAERVSHDTTEAGNIVQGKTSPRDLKNEVEQEDEQERINREVEEQQKSGGSTASKTAGPKAS